MVSSAVCERVIARALSRGGTFAELFIEDSRNFSMSLRDGRIENAALSRPYGAGVRVYDGLRSIYVYTCDVSESGLLRAAERAAAAVTDTPVSVGDIRLAERAHADIHPVKTPFLTVDAQKRAGVLRAVDKAARGVSASIGAGIRGAAFPRTACADCQERRAVYRRYPRLYPSALLAVAATAENQTGTRNPVR